MTEKYDRNKTFKPSLKFKIPNVSLALGFKGSPSETASATDKYSNV